jgi:hypothetical protein
LAETLYEILISPLRATYLVQFNVANLNTVITLDEEYSRNYEAAHYETGIGIV